MSQYNRSVVLAVLLAGLGRVAPSQVQTPQDLGPVIRELQQTLKDLDGRLTRMEQLLDQIVKSSGQSGRAANLLKAREAYQRGRSEEAQQEYEKAIVSYTQAVELDPGDDSALLHRAYVHSEVGRLDLALSDVTQSLAIQPNNARSYSFRASIFRRMKEDGRAFADLEEALSRDPANPEYLLLRASLEEERRDFKAAAETYAKALAIRPDSAEIHLKRAAALEELNELQMALEECAAALELKPTYAEAYARRADVYIRLGQIIQAVEDVKQIYLLKPALPEAATLVSAIRNLAELKELGEKASPARAPATPSQPSTPAVAVKSRIPVVTPSGVKPANLSASDYVRLGRSRTAQGKFPEGIQALTRAIEADPSMALAYNSRGYAYLRARHFRLAVRDFTAAIQINPNYLNAYWNRAVARRLDGDREGSLADKEKAAELAWVNTGRSVITTARR